MNQITNNATAESIRVASYNILADAYAIASRYPRSPTEALAAGPRLARLLAELTAIDADIYCLQEVEPSRHTAIAKHLGDAFASCYEQRHGHPDGCAIFYRHDRVALDHSDTLHYQAHEPGYDQLAQFGYFRCGEQPLAVANTHLRWQRRDTPRERHVGRLQLLELLTRRTGQLASWPSWLIAGDFNAASESVVIQAALERGLRLSCRTQRPWDTSNIGERCRKIDYLLYTPQQLTPTPGALPKLRRDTPLPSFEHSSDHLPVVVDFQWLAHMTGGTP